MIDELVSAMVPMLPVKIQEAEWNDPVLTVSGPNWSLYTLCSWRVVTGGRLLYGWSQPDAADRVSDLCGLSVVEVGVQSTSAPVDPVFHLSDGSRLEIFGDNAVEPWVLHLAKTTIVGSPTA